MNSLPGEVRPIRPRRLVVALAAFTVVVVLGVWGWSATAPRRAVERLSDEERRALYGRTIETLRSTCRDDHRPPALDDYCRGQADFIVLFPECEAACRDLARSERGAPER